MTKIKNGLNIILGPWVNLIIGIWLIILTIIALFSDTITWHDYAPIVLLTCALYWLDSFLRETEKDL